MGDTSSVVPADLIDRAAKVEVTEPDGVLLYPLGRAAAGMVLAEAAPALVAQGRQQERVRIRQEVGRMRSQAIDDRDSAIEGDRTVMATKYAGKKLGLDAVLLVLAALDKEVDDEPA